MRTHLFPFALFAGVLLLLVACASRELTESEREANAQFYAQLKRAAHAEATERAARDRKIAQAASNLGPLAQAVAARGEPALGTGIESQKQDIDLALGIPLSDYPLPVVDLPALLKDAQGALKVYKQKSDELQRKLDDASRAADKARDDRARAEALAENEQRKADAAARREWWYKVGAGALTVITAAAAIATRLGLPGGALLPAIVDMVAPARKARQVAAETAVAAADVGRQGLTVLEAYLSQQNPALAEQLATAVSAATGGRAGGLNELFKVAAKSYVLDNHGAQAEAVDSLLTDVRGRAIATQGGLATALQAILPAIRPTPRGT